MRYEGISIFGDPVPFGAFGGATAMDTICELSHGAAHADPLTTSGCACNPGFVQNQDLLWQCVAVAGEGGATTGGAQNLPPIDAVALAKQACKMAGLVWDDAAATCKPAGTVLPPPTPIPGATPAPVPAPGPAPGGKKTELLIPLLVGSAVILGVIAFSGKKRATPNRKRRSR